MADRNQDLAVRIIPYSNKLPEIFKKIKQSICRIIPYEIEIEHIGSTAVVGLGGKGIIDVLMITKRQQQLAEIAEILRDNGFSHNPKVKHNEDRFFVSGHYKYKRANLHIHIHIVFRNSKSHKNMLAFRDHLRLHPEEANIYYELKKKWSKEAGSDASKYTELKTSHINSILEKAREFKNKKKPF
ncbi:GrpB family protein [candidate division WOR-3 bacterium]|nr:GrpB family protein [candidate division WOR-3 bacterium]